MSENRKPKSINLNYHKASNRWYFRVSYGSKKIIVNGKPKYKNIKTDEYVTDIEYYPNPSNTIERKKSKDTVKFLNHLLEEKRVQLRNDKYKVVNRKETEANMLEDLRHYAYNNGYKPKTISTHTSIIKHLKHFTESDYISYRMIDEEFCRGYLAYLKNTIKSNGRPLASNTIAGYFNKFKIFLSTKEHLFGESPVNKIKTLKTHIKKKVSLTKEEVNAMMLAPCRVPVVKKFFLFSCFSGQAFAECNSLKWEDIYLRGDGVWCIDGKRIKTNSDYQVPLNDAATSIIGIKKGSIQKDNKTKVFKHLKYHVGNLEHLRAWGRIAKIDKHLTFHVARHTFSRLFYEQTKDVIALMEILDHKDISTTQRYLSSLLGKNYDKPKPLIGDFDVEKVNYDLVDKDLDELDF